MSRVSCFRSAGPAGCAAIAAIVSLCLCVGPSWAAPGQTESVLAGYTLKTGPIVVDGVRDNASGLAYDKDAKTLYMILNSPTVVVELDESGKPKRQIALKGFDDTEGLAVLAKNRLLVVEERKRNLVVVDLPEAGDAVAYEDCATFEIDPTPAGNSGLEGVTVDPDGKRVFIIKEKKPRKLYALPIPEAGQTPTITQPWDLEAKGFGMKDVGDLYFHSGSGHLLLLSDESHCIVECTPDGETELGRLSLEAGHAGLAETIPQPEGITMDEEGTLYVCSEPNLLFIFKKDARP